MNIDFSKLKNSNELTTNPKEIFQELRTNKPYNSLRPVQTEVLDKWHNLENNKDTIIKMNTGSGKTLVALLILESCIRRGKYPAVYLTPNNQLVCQVISEAKKFNIAVTDNVDDYEFAQGNKILVTNIFTIFNGKSIFGVNKERIKIGAIVIDDVHASFNILKNQFTINISDNELYNKIYLNLKADLKQYDLSRCNRIFEDNDPDKQMQIPFNIWRSHSRDILDILRSDLDEEQKKFKLPLIEDHFELCNCVATTHEIEISSEFVNTEIIKSFAKCNCRIFMSATMSDDSAFISAFNLSIKDLDKIITPESSSDIGERMILFPENLNSELSEDDVAEKISEFSKTYNVSVIVPSKKRASFWDKYNAVIVNDQNMEEILKKLQDSEHIGLTVFVNRYDGIDLPDEACRILVIDQAPILHNTADAIMEWSNLDKGHHISEKVQLIEQGMGRGVRSKIDYCGIIFLGKSINNLLYLQDGIKYLSEVTKAQLDLSDQIWQQMDKEARKDEFLSPLFELLNRNKKWSEKHLDCIKNKKYNQIDWQRKRIDSFRRAFNEAINRDYPAAVDILEKYLSKVKDIDTEEDGYIHYLIAKYSQFYDPTLSDEHLYTARKLNKQLPISDSVLNSNAQSDVIVWQGNNVVKTFFSNTENSSNSIEKSMKKITVLSYEDDVTGLSADQFEEAVDSLGKVLGFLTERPDKEKYKDGGPDNLWVVKETRFYVIECKNQERRESISKKSGEQLLSSVEWFKQRQGSYGHSCVPIMFHRSNRIDRETSMPEGTKIIDDKKLKNLIKAVEEYISALNKLKEKTPKNVQSLINEYGLNESNFLEQFTSKYKKN